MAIDFKGGYWIGHTNTKLTELAKKTCIVSCYIEFYSPFEFGKLGSRHCYKNKFQALVVVIFKDKQQTSEQKKNKTSKQAIYYIE